MSWEDYFEYRDGQLYWKYRSSMSRLWNQKYAGKRAGCLRSDGYRRVKVDKKPFYEHVIIYEMFNGPVPDGMDVDHHDLDKINNTKENLRLAERWQNKANGKLYKSSTTGVKGVLFHSRMQKYQVSISAKGITYHIGTFAKFRGSLK